MDAGYGTFLKGDGKGSFRYVPQLASGLSVKGCTRDLFTMKSATGNKVLFFVNGKAPVVYDY
jgi:hypothetical protein